MKQIFDLIVFAIVALPVAVVSYLWTHVKAGWAFGSWFREWKP